MVLDLGCGAGLIAADLTTCARVVGGRHLGGAARARATECAGGEVGALGHGGTRVRAGIIDAVVAFWKRIHVRREVHASLFARVMAG
jgi:hypothetical protein